MVAAALLIQSAVLIAVDLVDVLGRGGGGEGRDLVLLGLRAVLAYGLLGELGLAPLWHPVDDWTLWTAATRLAGAGGLAVGRSLLVVACVGAIALSASFTFYAGREITR